MAQSHTVEVVAPAKINLALHITGQRDDGYHLLDSLVGFADFGDVLSITAPADAGLSISGPFSGAVPTDGSNFILKMAEQTWPEVQMAFHLLKDLPVASGIGGGSADAAACYRAIAFLRERLGDPEAVSMMAEESIASLSDLGADIPMCVRSAPAHVTGIGEHVIALTDMPPLPVVLVNPGVPVSTPAVFRALQTKCNSPMSSRPAAPDADRLLDWMAEQRNDLQEPACELVPDIRTVLDCLAELEGCRLARMSGSGATCFGVFPDIETARTAEAYLQDVHPTWWARSGVINGPSRATPYLMRSTT